MFSYLSNFIYYNIYSIALHYIMPCAFIFSGDLNAPIFTDTQMTLYTNYRWLLAEVCPLELLTLTLLLSALLTPDNLPTEPRYGSFVFGRLTCEKLVLITNQDKSQAVSIFCHSTEAFCPMTYVQLLFSAGGNMNGFRCVYKWDFVKHSACNTENIFWQSRKTNSALKGNGNILRLDNG